MRAPQTSIFKDESEYRYFDFFITESSSCSGFFDAFCTDVWRLAHRLLLQISYQEEFARRGILAISALNRTPSSKKRPLDSLSRLDKRIQGCEEKQHRSFALQQYATSLRLMRQSTTTSRNDYRLRNILIACLITTYIECYQGNHQEAHNQAKIGIELISSFRKRRLTNSSISPQSSSKLASSIIDDDLIAAYSAIELLYRGERPKPF